MIGMHLHRLILAASVLAVGCGKSEPAAPAGNQAPPGRRPNSDMADLPDWIAAAHSTVAVEEGKLALAFYGERRIDDARALELLAVLENCRRLGDLEIIWATGSPITDTSFIEWGKAAQQGRLQSFRYLGFGGTKVSDKSSREWAKAAQDGRLQNLETLQLFDTEIGDGSMLEWARAAEAGKLTNLSELWLIQTCVSDESMTAWAKAAEAGHLTKLERLALFKTQVGDKTLAQWARAADAGKLPDLITFWLQETKVSAIDVDGRSVAVPEEYLIMGRAQDLFAWIRKQRN
jgi:hypothetical protein